jgi:large subunit ribosomal protein LP0
MIMTNRVKAPAKAGALAPLDVKVPAQNTGLGPEKTSFFQALNIPTKITKGTIEITNDVSLIKAGDRVITFTIYYLKISSIHCTL